MTNTEWSHPSNDLWVLVNSQGNSRTVMKQGPFLGSDPPAPKYVVSGKGYTTTEYWILQEAMDAAEESMRSESEPF
jgi:hypothetical protein